MGSSSRRGPSVWIREKESRGHFTKEVTSSPELQKIEGFRTPENEYMYSRKKRKKQEK
jgi:hypothetical protein